MSEVVFDDRGYTVTRHQQPDGPEVFYKDGPGLVPAQQHSYWRGYTGDGSCSGRLAGISTVAKNDGDTNNDRLLDWAAELTCEGIARELSLVRSLDNPEDIRDALSWAESGDAIWKTLERENLTWADIRKEKARIGTLSHGVLESLAADEEPTVVTGYDRAAFDWWQRRQPEVLQAEQVVYSAEHGFAGRLDLRVILTLDIDAPYALPDIAGLVAMADAKSSGYISSAFHIQIAGYDLAAEESGFGATDVGFILQLREDGTWHEWQAHATPDDFLAALAIYERGKRINSAARGDWRAMKKAQEATT